MTKFHAYKLQLKEQKIMYYKKSPLLAKMCTNSLPYFVHEESCFVITIEWTPLATACIAIVRTLYSPHIHIQKIPSYFHCICDNTCNVILVQHKCGCFADICFMFSQFTLHAVCSGQLFLFLTVKHFNIFNRLWREFIIINGSVCAMHCALV